MEAVEEREGGWPAPDLGASEPGATEGGNLVLVAMTPPPAPDGFEVRYIVLFVRAQRCAQRILSDRAAAEDVAAETMARAYARWSKISSYAPAWVSRVAMNLAMDQLRRRPAVVTERVEPADGSVDRLMLRQQLVKLPRRQRDAIVARYVLGFDEKETAELLGVSVGTVHTHVKRGLARLRGELVETSLGADER